MYTFSCHQKTIKYAIAYMSRTQIEFITPKCSRLLYGMFQELFEQIINIFLPKESPQSDFLLFARSLFFSPFVFFCHIFIFLFSQKSRQWYHQLKKVLRCIWNFKKLSLSGDSSGKNTQIRPKAVQKCQSKLNKRNTIKRMNVATSSNRINKLLLVTVVAVQRHKKENKIISFSFC